MSLYDCRTVLQQLLATLLRLSPLRYDCCCESYYLCQCRQGKHTIIVLVDELLACRC
jgi:hypothetical protein